VTDALPDGVAPPPVRTVAQDAQLALLLEVTGTPKPGNVDRAHDHDDLRFEHFATGAVGALPGLRLAADGEPVGRAFERAVAGMSQQAAGNTQFGALLVLTPLVRAAGDGDCTPGNARAAAEATTVRDAANFYRAFEHVDVAVDEPPKGMEPLDVRRGAAAIPTLRERGLTLHDVMDRSTDVDGLAREWVGGFERSFHAADRLLDTEGAVPDRAARVFLELLADEPDTFVAINHGQATAERVSEQAAEALDGERDPWALADELVAEGVNPGTTADLIAAGLFVALRRGLEL
jgi:triphosphoribosyl-dephospho-CoA synthase